MNTHIVISRKDNSTMIFENWDEIPTTVLNRAKRYNWTIEEKEKPKLILGAVDEDNRWIEKMKYYAELYNKRDDYNW